MKIWIMLYKNKKKLSCLILLIMEGCADLQTSNLCRIIAMGDEHGCFLPAGLIACHLYMHNWLYLIIKIILYIQSFAPMNSFFFPKCPGLLIGILPILQQSLRT